MYRSQGSRGLAIYLKAANLLLIRATSGKGLSNSRDAGCAVSVNGSRLPRCIVPIHRRRISSGEGAVIRLWLGFFTLYRVLTFRGKLSLASIVKPGADLPDDLLREWRFFLRKVFMPLLRKLDIRPLETRLTKVDLLDGREFQREKSYWYFPSLEGQRRVIQTSGPSSGQGVGGSSIIGHDLDVWNWVNSTHYSLLHGMCLFTGNLRFISSSLFQSSRSLIRKVREGHYPWLQGAVNNGTEGLLGSLAIREEPGKLRIFAMVDSLTQWVLYPLHTALFSMLAKIPQDGTFNQTKPVEDLLDTMKTQGLEHVWSYDLSAATDRIPLVLQEYLLGQLTSPDFAWTWAKFLCDRLYKVPRDFMTTLGEKGWKADPLLRSHPPGYVRYVVGQPMGAYSSWAMLAFVHHAVIQYSAWKVGFRGWFSLYAVLGDDIVIAHREVANRYVQLMTEIGVDIGFHKSVISNNRSLEFAKRYYYKGEEVTPLPLLGIATGWLGVSLVPEVISVVERLTGKVLSTFQIAKYMGVGFRAASGADHKSLWLLPRRLRSTLILLLRPGAPRGADDAWAWLRAKSLRGQAVVNARSVEALGAHLVKWASKERFPRLLKLLETNLNKFVPQKTWHATEDHYKEYLTWFDTYVTQFLRQDFMVQRMHIEGLLRGLQPFYLSSDKAITDLLNSIEEFESEISEIPKEVARHKSQLAETSVKLLPNLVDRWISLGRFLERTSSKTRRVAKRVRRGDGASPLLRTK